MKKILSILLLIISSSIIIISCGGGGANVGPSSTFTLKGSGN
jgi:hypothetical protein